jgi:anaerobic magnesium-protoporphyrin IX monomethyl ester cyclase
LVLKPHDFLAGYDPAKSVDAIFLNAPLRDYSERPRVNDFTLPVLGMGYIATCAEEAGFNVAVLDAEAHGLGLNTTANIVNEVKPRWVGLNLLAPTYENSARIAAMFGDEIKLMLGGHQAKAMPTSILRDPRMKSCEALVIGEAETRVVALLDDFDRRSELPGVMWLDPLNKEPKTGGMVGNSHHLAPDINKLPFVERKFFTQDPHVDAGHLEANMVGARGCFYDCSFCGAAVSANLDIAIRTRDPWNILEEMSQLRSTGVTAFRFVDDLFLGVKRVIKPMMEAFTTAGVGDWAFWDATGRINVLDRLSDDELDLLKTNGLREVALGIESGNQRILTMIDKRITPEMSRRVIRRLLDRGINVKGYFILGFPDETTNEIDQTVKLIEELWTEADPRAGIFRASTFEYRPYPGTTDWTRLMATGKYSEAQLLN